MPFTNTLSLGLLSTAYLGSYNVFGGLRGGNYFFLGLVKSATRGVVGSVLLFAP